MLKVSKNRMAQLLDGLAQFGRTLQGTTRLAYSAEDRAAQKWLLEKIQTLKLTVTEDVVGNVFLYRAGTAEDLACVATGSHLDTVINGGNYDGICGIVSAVEALYMLQDEKLQRGIKVIIFRAEESSRFGFATIGSKLLTGQAKPEDFDKGCRSKELTLIEALRQWGGVPEKYQEAVLNPDDYTGFIELHIEQGKVLENKQYQLGIVDSIAAPVRFKIRLQGVADHSGATPMDMRQDALVSGAKIILAVQQAGLSEKDCGTVATVGIIEVQPASINVIPGEAVLWVDVRGIDRASIKRAVSSIKEAVLNTSKEDGITAEIIMLTADEPVSLDKNLGVKLEQICRSKGYSCLHMHSGAGHDAMNMTKLMPATMLFIPCRNGISHNKAEYADIDALCRGTEVLAEFLKQEANK